MQRQIKFRAWGNESEMMIRPGDSNEAGYPWEFSVAESGISLKSYWDEAGYCAGDAVLMQYTGLKDKNGVEIYEGDILLHHDKHYEVKWDEYMAAFQAENMKDDVDSDFFNWGNVPSLQTQDVPTLTEPAGANCEVIGNIWENKELLDDSKRTEAASV